MNPKDKAIEIYNRFYGIPLYVLSVKQCCYILIDEILQADEFMMSESQEKFWQNVKKEIEKI